MTLQFILKFFPTLILVLSVCGAVVAAYFYFVEGAEIAKQPFVYWSSASVLTYSVTYL